MIKSKLLIAILVIAVAATIASQTASANPGVPSSITDLEASFAGFETFLTDLTSEVDANTIDIIAIQAQISLLSIVDESQYQVQMTTQASSNGAINPQKTEFVFYGDVLCEIEASGYVVIQFGGTTTVKHNNNCSTSNGDVIILDTAIDEFFKPGDILVLDKITTTWNEVYRNQTP